MKSLFTIFSALFVLFTSQYQAFSSQRDPALKPFESLLGTWEMKTANGFIYEDWDYLNDTTLIGRSFKAAGGDTQLLETIHLIKKADGVYYIPVVEDQNNRQPVPFMLLQADGKGWVFENKAHDFPQRIVYVPVAGDSLQARIEGVRKGKEAKSEFPYKRVSYIGGHFRNAPGNMKTLNGFYGAKTLDEALAFYSEDFQMHFSEKEGEGLSKGRVAELLTWDYALHPEVKVVHAEFSGDSAAILVTHEENDFSKLLGFPGWDATISYHFTDAGLLREKLYVPIPGKEKFLDYFDQALAWLEKNRGETLREVFRNNRIVQNAETAPTWVALLKEWRIATDK